MKVRDITAKSILRKQKRLDSWFLSSYSMNLYRGCSHNCSYCDGRSERYNVAGDFGTEVGVKINAIDLLAKELNPERKRTPFPRGFILLGGGVGDSYQPAEARYKLSRKTLQLIADYGLPVHILTKSTLVARDLDLLKEVNRRQKVIVSFSLSSMDTKLSEIFEPGVPPPPQRLETLSRLKAAGIHCGIYLMPVIPYITDNQDNIAESISKAKLAGAEFMIFGGLTLKSGRQENYFMNILQQNFPGLAPRYRELYQGDPWGQAHSDYYKQINETFYRTAAIQKIPIRIPMNIFKDILNTKDLAMVTLEHIDYILKLQGQKSSYGYAAYSLAKSKNPIPETAEELKKMGGINEASSRIIQEIVETGTSSLYRSLNRIFQDI